MFSKTPKTTDPLPVIKALSAPALIKVSLIKAISLSNKLLTVISKSLDKLLQTSFKLFSSKALIKTSKLLLSVIL